ncbi:MAG: hypothetical protein HY674_11125 [Chloroflexi bacterium]|nr:hypothetical protein [Chloroflexota bacterium]
MISRTTPEFWQHYERLPKNIQRLADKGYKLWSKNPRHPSFRFKKLAGYDTLYSARVGDHYRALAQVEGSSVVWTWIGSHEEYNQLLRR